VTLAWSAYRILAPCLGALAPAARAFTSPAEQELWGERLGRVTLADGCDAWVHAASMGEATAVRPLVGALRAFHPRARLHLTATTRTGRMRLATFGDSVSLAPIDAPQAVGRFLAGVRPRRMLLVETELWPHWLLRARASQIPVAVVSARLSERSVARYGRLGPELRRLVSGLAAVLCQTPEDLGRWRALGAPPERTAVTGNLKYDALPEPPPSRPQARAEAGLDRDRPLLVLGSLRPGEARILARVWKGLPLEVTADWQVVAVPRHVHATPGLVAEAESEGLKRAPQGESGWRWDDRPGVLLGYYAAADVAFVGGSLAPYGGHNPLEPAACGAAVVLGAHTKTQADAVRALAQADAVTVARTAEALRSGLERLLASVPERCAQVQRALAVVAALRGSARRTVAQLAAWALWPD